MCYLFIDFLNDTDNISRLNKKKAPLPEPFRALFQINYFFLFSMCLL